MSEQISLYDPRCQLPDPPLQELHRTHWRKAQLKAQEFLTEFLGVENGGGVMLFDRCTHAITAALQLFASGVGPVAIPRETYRAALDAAVMAGEEVELRPERELFVSVLGGCGCTPSALIQTWLWGQAPEQLYSDCTIIHDCAHTCYPGMFRGWRWEGGMTAAVLSFFPTKPCGAFGGGALIGNAKTLKAHEALYFPLDPGRRCNFTYPQTIQSWGIQERCSQYSENYWSGVRGGYWSIHDWLVEHGFESAGPPRGTVYTPHLLPFRRTPELEQLCERAGLETGNHYPLLDTGEVVNITLPFWTPEVLHRLNASYQPVGQTRLALACPSSRASF